MDLDAEGFAAGPGGDGPRLTGGDRLGPYVIDAPLGAGGMGAVYRARDTRLGRTVAIKILSAELADRADVQKRFEVEARAVASLNHPHICALFDIGRQDGVAYMVMECVEGETLEHRLKNGPLPLDEAIRYAIQVADALEQAHRRGVVHRDIKPANIMLTKTGVKLLDFGLARLRERSPVAGDKGETVSMTGVGTVLGTPLYMSPEQVEGKEADARADVFAFGSVLYEMVSGKRAFTGESQASLMAAILRGDPPSAPRDLPRELAHVLKTCWAKDPDKRWQSAGDLRLELEWIAEGGEQAPPVDAGGMRRREVLAWGTAGFLGAAGSFGIFRGLRAGVPEPAPVRFTIPPPPGMAYQLFSSLPAVSPDGRTVATVAFAGGAMSIWVRPIDSLEAREVPETQGATAVFWSPNSRYIGFFAQDRLMRVPLAGGPAQVICGAPGGGGGAAWNEAGVIVFAPGHSGALYMVPATGGTPTPVTSLEPLKHSAHWHPCFLPGGRRFLFTALSPQAEHQGVYAGTLGSPDVERLLPVVSNVRYAQPGYVLFSQHGKLMAQRFDAGRRRFEDDPFPVATNVWSFGGAAAFSVSDSGILVYAEEVPPRNQLTWLDRQGKRMGAVGPEGPFIHMDLSRDERRVLLERYENSLGELWSLDLARGVPSRLTAGLGWALHGCWSPDGTRVVYASASGTAGGIYLRDEAGHEEQFANYGRAAPGAPTDWSPDGKYIIYWVVDAQTGSDIWVAPVSGEGKPVAYLQSRFAERQGRLSPDGRWMAYVTNETGSDEVYIASFPSPGSNHRISDGGGVQPQWGADGKELFYISPAERTLMAVSIKTAPVFQPGTPEPLFRANFVGFSGFSRRDYAVSGNGRRFLVNTNLGGGGSQNLTAVVGWRPAASRAK